MAQLVLTSGQNTNDFVLDALPYIDDAQYDESHRRFALKLIEDEQKRFPLTKDYLKNFSKPNYSKFLTPSLEGEFKRMSEGKPMPEFDANRYMVPAPSTSADKSDWLKAINNCDAQIEHIRLRKLNMDLMQEHGGHALVRLNKALQHLSEQEDQSVFKLRSELFEIHSRRKRRQEQVGGELMSMGSQWIVSVNKNIQLDEAIQRAESELKATCKRLKIEYDYTPEASN